MQSPSRRALLGVLGTLPLTACLDSDSPGTPVSETPTGSPTNDPTPTDSPTDGRDTATDSATNSEPILRQPGDSYETDDLAVTVSDLAVRHGMVEFRAVHPDPIWRDGAQFLLANVTVEGEEDPANIDLTVTADTLDSRPDRFFGFRPDRPDSAESLGFAVPTDPAPSEVAVVWHGPREVRWPLPDELVRKLGHAPDFSLEGFRVPESAPMGVDIDVTLEVRNDGDRDGQFLAELGTTSISDQSEMTVQVPAGETVTATRSVNTYSDDGERTVILRWEGGVRRETVTEA